MSRTKSTLCHRDMLDCLGPPAEIAAAVHVTVHAVRKWRERDNIPSRYWSQITTGARVLGHGGQVNLEALAAARKRRAA